MSKAEADAEMKEAKTTDSKKEEKVEEVYDPYYEIKKNLIILEKHVKDQDMK